MESLGNQLLNILEGIEGNGSFALSGTKEFVPPGLQIGDITEISFPITPSLIAELLKVAHKAPFGKGSQTIIDTTVRSAWEIDAEEILFLNPNWNKFIDGILEDAKIGLGLEHQDISANLYKMLIYETGDFFLPHKDSEKEPGMFGTLILGLPSKHTGGALSVRFDNKEQIIDFSEPVNEYKIPFAAFYADCEHEIKPLTSGYRVCLVYNLVQTQGLSTIHVHESQDAIADLTTLLQEADIQNPFAVLLGHQYTPTNFSMDALKHHDRPRAEALLEAAEKAGFYAKLGLITCYQMGDLEPSSNSYGRRKRRYYDDEDEDVSDGVMGSEIYEEYIHIEHWSKDESLPPLRSLTFDENDIITDMELRDGDPTEKEAEGYTGNAGMTMQYWYHYGAIVLWHKSQHFDMLYNQSIENKLEWLTHYLHHWEPNEIEAIKKILVEFTEKDLVENYQPKDFSVVAPLLVKLNDIEYVRSESCQSFLVTIFDRIKVENWLKLTQAFDISIFETLFTKVAAANKLTNIKHLSAILEGLISVDSKEIEAFVLKQMDLMPFYLENYQLPEDLKQQTSSYYYNLKTESSQHENTVKAILRSVLQLSKLKNDNVLWVQNTLNSLVKSLTRAYVNEVLVTTLLASEQNKNLNLAQKLAAVCQQDLIARTITKPTPPATWTREVPKSDHNKEMWKTLTPFLTSPTEKVFEYRMAEAYRNSMASAILNVTIDLTMETLKKGSPHVLKLTKTQTAYEKDLKEWHEDVGILGKIEAFYGMT